MSTFLHHIAVALRLAPKRPAVPPICQHRAINHTHLDSGDGKILTYRSCAECGAATTAEPPVGLPRWEMDK